MKFIEDNVVLTRNFVLKVPVTVAFLRSRVVVREGDPELYPVFNDEEDTFYCNHCETVLGSNTMSIINHALDVLANVGGDQS